MQHYPPPKKTILGRSVSSTFKGAVLGCLPNCKAERNLVDKVGEVVDQIEAAVIHTTHEVAKEVAGRVDRPACSDNETHCAEGGHHILVCCSKVSCNSSGLATEDLEEDEEPSAHATCKTNPCAAG